MIINKSIILILTIFLFSCIPYHYNKSTEEEIFDTLKKGDMIVDALENYRKDNGHYPRIDSVSVTSTQELSLLIPKYLNNIPKPSVKSDTHFRYFTPYNKDEYEIFFYATFESFTDWSLFLDYEGIIRSNKPTRFIYNPWLYKFCKRGITKDNCYNGWLHR